MTVLRTKCPTVINTPKIVAYPDGYNKTNCVALTWAVAYGNTPNVAQGNSYGTDVDLLDNGVAIIISNAGLLNGQIDIWLCKAPANLPTTTR